MSRPFPAVLARILQGDSFYAAQASFVPAAQPINRGKSFAAYDQSLRDAEQFGLNRGGTCGKGTRSYSPSRRFEVVRTITVNHGITTPASCRFICDAEIPVPVNPRPQRRRRPVCLRQ